MAKVVKSSTIRIRSIGIVRRLQNDENVRDRSLACKIVLDKRLMRALDGISWFSHLFILFWMHGIRETDRRVLRVHPRGRKDVRLQGVYATRGARRPNPIGLTLVRLLSRRANVLRVQGLDAADGTPVLDIKPYDYWDSTQKARVPAWWLKLERERIKRSSLAKTAR